MIPGESHNEWYQYYCLNFYVSKVQNLGPQGFLGSEKKGYLFSGSWGALVIILRDLRSKLIVLGRQGALQKSKINKF